MAKNKSLDTFVEQLLTQKEILNRSLREKQAVFHSFGYDSPQLKSKIKEYQSQIKFVEGQIFGYLNPEYSLEHSDESYRQGFYLGTQTRISPPCE